MNTNQESFVRKNLKFNFVVNLLDGGFFGFGLGFGSFNAILPLFVSQFTNSALLIGLVPAIHNMGWQLPQLLVANRISQLKQYKPFVQLMTLNERIPFLGFAIVSLLSPSIGAHWALILTFILLVWQGLGAGFTGNAWQMMVSKIIPSEFRGTFFGAQAAAANLLASFGAAAAGFIIEANDPAIGFAKCFGAAIGLMLVSLIFLNQTREPESFPVIEKGALQVPLWKNTISILNADRAFLGFLITRWVFQFGMMAFAFYIVYGVKYLDLSESAAGLMTSILMVTQVVANPLLGWLADHWNHRRVIELGAIAAVLSSVLALCTSSVFWFAVIMVLTGIANTAFWTVGIAYTLEFGTEQTRPTYVGIVNTLGAPAAILAPLCGGWLADTFGYSSTFIVSSAAAFITAILLHFFIKSPRAEENPTHH